MIGMKEMTKHLISYSEVERVMNSAKEQAAREASEDRAYALDAIEILAVEIVRLQQWGMWTLSPEDVLEAANGNAINSEEMEDIRRLFRKGFEASQDNWSEILADAIGEVCK